jgi:hypothetical protein
MPAELSLRISAFSGALPSVFSGVRVLSDGG